MVRILTGTERYIIDNTINSKKSNDVDFLVLYDVEDLRGQLFKLSFQKRVIVLKIKRLDGLTVELVESVMGNPMVDLYVDVASVDKRKASYKELSKYIEEFNHLTDEKTVSKFVLYETKKRGGVITPDGIKMLLKRSNYLKDTEMNLYSLMNIVYDLLDASDTITADVVESLVTENFKANAFKVSEFLMDRDVESAYRTIHSLGEEPMKVIGALLSNYKTAYMSNLYGERCFSKVKNLDNNVLLGCIRLCTKSLQDVRGGRLQDKEALALLVTDLYELMEEAA